MSWLPPSLLPITFPRTGQPPQVDSLEAADQKIDELAASGKLDPALLLMMAKAYAGAKETNITQEEVGAGGGGALAGAGVRRALAGTWEHCQLLPPARAHAQRPCAQWLVPRLLRSIRVMHVSTHLLRRTHVPPK